MGKEKFRSNSSGEDKTLPSNFAIVRSQQFSMETELFPVGTDFRGTFSVGQLFVGVFLVGRGSQWGSDTGVYKKWKEE